MVIEVHIHQIVLWDMKVFYVQFAHKMCLESFTEDCKELIAQNVPHYQFRLCRYWVYLLS